MRRNCTKNIVLTIAIPTYKRSWCIKRQIERLGKIKELCGDRVEILISDNCSPDDTQNIVAEASMSGFECTYIRNTENIGAARNFIQCLHKASGKYVLLLGDDDLVNVLELAKIVDILSVNSEYGLCFIDMQNKLPRGEYRVYSNPAEVAEIMGYWSTFMSASIVNRKFVEDIDYDKYIETHLTQLPLYLTALFSGYNNIVCNFPLFDENGADAKTNGGYNFYEVFIVGYLGIWREFIKGGSLSNKLFRYIKKDIFPFIWGFTIQLLIHKEVGRFKTEKGWKILFMYYGNEWYFWRTLLKYPFGVIKRKIKKLL